MIEPGRGLADVTRGHTGVVSRLFSLLRGEIVDYWPRAASKSPAARAYSPVCQPSQVSGSMRGRDAHASPPRIAISGGIGCDRKNGIDSVAP